MPNTLPFVTTQNLYFPRASNGVYNSNIKFISNTYSSSYTGIYSIDTTNNIMPEYAIYNKDDSLMTSVDGIKYSEFGSLDSLDVDVMFYLHYPLESIKWCKDKAAELKYKVDKKYVDVNFAVMNSDYRLSSCYKGSVDEVNNMLYYTSGIGDRIKSAYVTRLYPRDIVEKKKRIVRGILSYLSRTAHRKDIKKVLGKYELSVDLFNSIEIKYIIELNKNNVTYSDFCKFLAFQYAQLDGLVNGVEVFTKQQAVALHHELDEFIYRKSTNLDLVEELQKRLRVLFVDKKEFALTTEYINQFWQNSTYLASITNNVIFNSTINPKLIYLPLNGIDYEEYSKVFSKYFSGRPKYIQRIALVNDKYCSVWHVAINLTYPDDKSDNVTKDEIINFEICHIKTLNELRRSLK
jgi:hypothetical protein